MKRIGRSARAICRSGNGGLATEFPGRPLLTPREYQVLELIAHGSSNKEVGRRLGISPRTVEVHRAHIMDKIGAENSLDLIHKVMAERH